MRLLLLIVNLSITLTKVHTMPIYHHLIKIYNKDGISNNFNYNANRTLWLFYVLMPINKRKIQLNKIVQTPMTLRKQLKIRQILKTLSPPKTLQIQLINQITILMLILIIKIRILHLSQIKLHRIIKVI